MNVDDVFDYVYEKYGYTKGILRGTARSKDVVLARHVAMYMVVENCGLSFPQAGKVFGKDHTTVLNAYHKVRGLIIDGELDLKVGDYEPKVRHQLKIDEIVGDTLEMLKRRINIAFSQRPYETLKELCDLAIRLENMNKKE